MAFWPGCGPIWRTCPAPDGSPLGNRVIDPRQAYAARQGAPPELMLYPGDLAWRAVGTVWPGQGPLFTFETTLAPDDANHAPDGVLIAALAGSGPPARRGRRGGRRPAVGRLPQRMRLAGP